MTRDWRKESARLAREYAFSVGQLYPEYISGIGYSSFDSKATPFGKELEEKRYIQAYKWQQKLQRLLEEETHPELRTDIKILLSNSTLEMESIELNRKEGIVPFIPISEFVFSNLKRLLNKEAKKTKIHSGLIRFRQYVRGSESQLPLVDGFTAHIINRLDQLADKRKRGFWPTKSEINDYLKGSDQYFKEIEGLLSVWPEHDWRRDLEELKIQERNYREFLRKKILPYARTTWKMPKKIYSFTLKDYGVYSSPSELIKTAKGDYKRTYEEFKKLAELIASKNNLPSSYPVEVIKYLSSQRFATDEDLLNFYRLSAKRLLKIVKENKLLTLKNHPDFIIRFGTKAEMQSIPAPHFEPPPLLEKTSEKGQYIIPRTSGENGMNDYGFREAIINLTAHEGVPGHALQFQSMKERGTTLIRARFAFNSANVEGWAHYAEEIVYPYLSLEEKFITLQRRLWRQARMYLDPELNLGNISGKRVFEVFQNELGFSKEFSESEFKRYSFLIPGQAASYYYGKNILINLKNQLKDKLQDAFTEACFNDALLDLGVMPLQEINDRLKDNLTCSK